MDWTMLGAMGELVGAVVVGITVIYLARQVRLSNQMSKAEAWRSFVGKLVDVDAAQSSDPVFRRAVARALLEGATRDPTGRSSRKISRQCSLQRALLRVRMAHAAIRALQGLRVVGRSAVRLQAGDYRAAFHRIVVE